LFNYSLGFFPATIVSITTQSLTITAAVIAFFLFAEVPTWIEIGGSVVIMGGVMMAIVAKR
jgi:drug/metabolite transporter (DMT)-like permease